MIAGEVGRLGKDGYPEKRKAMKVTFSGGCKKERSPAPDCAEGDLDPDRPGGATAWRPAPGRRRGFPQNHKNLASLVKGDGSTPSAAGRLPARTRPAPGRTGGDGGSAPRR